MIPETELRTGEQKEVALAAEKGLTGDTQWSRQAFAKTGGVLGVARNALKTSWLRASWKVVPAVVVEIPISIEFAFTLKLIYSAPRTWVTSREISRVHFPG